jgi:VCBS repeat-containing protein
MSLASNYTFVGKGNWSLDGVGGQLTGGGTISAVIPDGSKVEQAFLYTTTFYGGFMTSVDLALGSNTDTVTSFAALGLNAGLQAFRSDVTSYISSVVGNGDPAQFDFTVSNIDGSAVDGFALVVVYSNPNEDTRTISLLDGFSASSGDSFTLTFSDPVDTTQPGFEAQMSLGIGYSYYPSNQYSTISVDGRQLTQSAGSQDDGANGNGGLITIGGIGDSTANPDPDQPIGDIRTDDELYDLAQGNVDNPAPYIANGASSISVATLNPSNDDNIFFAGFNITAVVSVDTNQNDPPVAVGDEVSLFENATAVIPVLGNDFDPDGNPLTLDSVNTAGLVGLLTVNPDGTVTYDPNGAFDYLGEGESATTSFTYTIRESTPDAFTSTATVTITVNGVGEDGPPPDDCPVVARAGTVDGSASTSDLLTGPDYHNTFYFDVEADSGNDTITNFQNQDVIVTTEKIYDKNDDGLIGFGKNGKLDLDGPSGDSDLVTFAGGVKGLRYLGQSCDDSFVYANAKVRPVGAIEGYVSDDILTGDAANTKAETFFYDTALDINLGNDVINKFGAGDKIVTTTKLFDSNNDDVIGFGSNKLIDLSGGTGGPDDPGLPGEVGTIALYGVDGSQITSLHYAGMEVVGDTTYYTYTL